MKDYEVQVWLNEKGRALSQFWWQI